MRTWLLFRWLDVNTKVMSIDLVGKSFSWSCVQNFAEKRMSLESNKGYSLSKSSSCTLVYNIVTVQRVLKNHLQICITYTMWPHSSKINTTSCSIIIVWRMFLNIHCKITAHRNLDMYWIILRDRGVGQGDLGWLSYTAWDHEERLEWWPWTRPARDSYPRTLSRPCWWVRGVPSTGSPGVPGRGCWGPSEWGRGCPRLWLHFGGQTGAVRGGSIPPPTATPGRGEEERRRRGGEEEEKEMKEEGREEENKERERSKMVGKSHGKWKIAC